MGAVRYAGHERRHSSSEEREEYRRQNGLPAPQPPPATLLQAATVYLGMLPKPILILAVLSLSGWAGHQGWLWAQGVDGQVVRLQKVEALAASTVQSVERVQGEVTDLRVELREMRRDQLTFYRWQAEQFGDRAKVREMDRRLKSIESEP